MLRSLTVATCSVALLACTSVQPVKTERLNRYAGSSVSIAVDGDGYSDVEIDRVVDGVLYTTDGQTFNLNDIETASATRFSVGRTLLLTAAVLGGLTYIAVRETEDAISDLFNNL